MDRNSGPLKAVLSVNIPQIASPASYWGGRLEPRNAGLFCILKIKKPPDKDRGAFVFTKNIYFALIKINLFKYFVFGHSASDSAVRHRFFGNTEELCYFIHVEFL